MIRLPEHYGLLSPILHVVPLQLLAYHTALARGTDVDKPRNSGEIGHGGITLALQEEEFMNSKDSPPPWRPQCCAPRSAQAQTEIQWWHSMTGALGDTVNELADRLQRQPEGIQGGAGLQGQLSRVDDRGDRRVPRRQRAAHPAGVRGRHRHHDGGQGRDHAGAPDDGGRQGAVRTKDYLPAGGRLLHRQQGQHAVDALQQLDAGVLHQQGRLQEGRPRPGEGAEDLEGVRRRGGQAQGLGPAVRLHHRLAVLDAHRELQRLAQRADRHQAERHRRHRHRVHASTRRCT